MLCDSHIHPDYRMLAIPTTAVYFVAYETLRDSFAESGRLDKQYGAPFVSGAFARGLLLDGKETCHYCD